MIERLEGLLKEGREDAMLRFGLGSAYFNEAEFEKAVPHLKQCIALDESYSAAYKLLGRALVKTGHQEEAISVFRTGVEVAGAAGDKQSEKEIRVFLTRLEKKQ